MKRLVMRSAVMVALVVVAGAAALTLTSADHSDSPLVAADAASDINDLYAFRSPDDPNRLVLAMTTNPFIPPTEAAAASFSTDVLYEFKIDTDGDALEDYVVQATFAGSVPSQTVTVSGPARSVAGSTRTSVMAPAVVVSGAVSTAQDVSLLSVQGMDVFAGVREDPFFLDFEQLSMVLAGQARSFRDPGIDTFAGLNVLAIVVEFPLSMIGGATDLGIWATTSTINR